MRTFAHCLIRRKVARDVDDRQAGGLLGAGAALLPYPISAPAARHIETHYFTGLEHLR
jgi:hypothetical protein